MKKEEGKWDSWIALLVSVVIERGELTAKEGLHSEAPDSSQRGAHEYEAEGETAVINRGLNVYKPFAKLISQTQSPSSKHCLAAAKGYIRGYSALSAHLYGFNKPSYVVVSHLTSFIHSSSRRTLPGSHRHGASVFAAADSRLGHLWTARHQQGRRVVCS